MRTFSQKQTIAIKMYPKTIFIALAIVSILNEAKCSVNTNSEMIGIGNWVGNGQLISTLINTLDSWDVKHPKYKLIGNWVTLVRTKEERNANEVESSVRDQNQREDFGAFLGRVARFVDTHRLDINMPIGYMSNARSFIDESRSSKLKRFIIPFVVLMILKKSIEIPIFLAVVSLIAFSGLGAGLMSLMLSGATAFKSILEHHSHSSKVSYEVVPQINHWSRAGSSSGVDYPNLSDATGYNPYHTIPHGAK